MLELPPGLGFDRSLQQSQKHEQSGTAQLASRETEAATPEASAEQPVGTVQHKQKKARNRGRRKQKPATATCSLVVASDVADGASEARPAPQHKQDGIVGEAKSTEESEAEKVTTTDPVPSCASVQAYQLLPASSKAQRGDAGSLSAKSASGRVEKQAWIDEAVLSAISRPGGSSKRRQAEVPGPPGLGLQPQPQFGSSPPRTTSTDAQGKQHRRKAIPGAVHGNILPMRRSSMEECQGTDASVARSSVYRFVSTSSAGCVNACVFANNLECFGQTQQQTRGCPLSATGKARSFNKLSSGEQHCAVRSG